MVPRHSVLLGTITAQQVLLDGLPLFENCVCTLERLSGAVHHGYHRVTFAIARDAWTPLLGHLLMATREDAQVTCWQLLRAERPTFTWYSLVHGFSVEAHETELHICVDFDVMPPPEL